MFAGFLRRIAELPERQSLHPDLFRSEMKSAQTIGGIERRPCLNFPPRRRKKYFKINGDLFGIKRVEILFTQIKARDQALEFHPGLRKNPVFDQRRLLIPFPLKYGGTHLNDSILFLLSVKRNTGGEYFGGEKAAPCGMVPHRKQRTSRLIETDGKTSPFARIQPIFPAGLKPGTVFILQKDPCFERMRDSIRTNFHNQLPGGKSAAVRSKQEPRLLFIKQNTTGELRIENRGFLDSFRNCRSAVPFRFPVAGEQISGMQKHTGEKEQKDGRRFHAAHFCVHEFTSHAGGPL